MAKRVISESYTFTPSTSTLVINNKWIRREQLLLITNVTTNTIIYNFTDSTRTASAYTNSNVGGNNEQTTIVFTYSGVTSMSSTDHLSILVEETDQSMIPGEAYMDPVGKLRTSTPQALIDTDFEYGTQSTKWESISLLGVRSSAFFDVTQPITSNSATVTINGIPNIYNYTSITGTGSSRLVTVNIPNTVGITLFTPIYVQDTIDWNANGWYLPYSITPNTSITYYAKGNVTNGTISDPTKTLLFVGNFYTQAGISVNSITNSSTTVTVTTTNPHGLQIGNFVMIMGTAASTNPPNGVYQVLTMPTVNTFTFSTANSTGAPTGSIIFGASVTSGSVTAASTIFTVTTITGTIPLMASVSGSGITTATYITGQISGVTTATTITATGGSTGQSTITTASTSGVVIGQFVTGTGIPPNTYVQSFVANTSVTLTQALTSTAAGTVNLYTAGGAGTYSMSAAANASGSGAYTIGTTTTLFNRPWGSAIHRAYDGGVLFNGGYPYHSQQLIRQTRRTFRYQSGKGIQFSTGSNMCAPFFTDSITSSGTTATVTVKFPHNLGVGAVVAVSGASDATYNGNNFTVTSVPTDLTFTYTTSGTPSTTTPTGLITVQPYKWYNSNVRIGMFTHQNGFFFQYNGQTLSAVRRSASTAIVSGYITSLANGSQSVTGTNTQFSSQLAPGDTIVIRGQAYLVTSILSDTSLIINPDYRGTSISSPSQVVIAKVQDTIMPQSTWNIDKMDGTGVSGNTIDITKMQMFYMDYSWYGAGAIRWGFKNARGEINYVHREAHGNIQYTSYMRSGNLPGRYEIDTIPTRTVTSATINSGDSTVTVASTTGFPAAGTIQVTGSGATAPIEFISYTGISGNQFTGCTRAITNLSGPGNPSGANMGGAASAQTFTFSSTAPVLVQSWAPQVSITISHWGSSVTMDGRYDDDKSLVFVAGMTTTISNIGQNVTQPLISIRLAPSVDSGIGGVIGQREILNTMQLIFRACDAYTTGTGMTFLITLRLNGVLGQGTGSSMPAFQAQGGSSLSQVAYHVAGNTIVGGENMFGFFTTTPGVTSGDLSIVRDIGTSIISGGNTLSVPTSNIGKYPDGPDVVTICATNVTNVTTNTINARLSWTEAQA